MDVKALVLFCAVPVVAAPAFAATLTCKGNAATLIADVGYNYNNAQATDSNGRDLRATGPVFLDDAGVANATYTITLEALNEDCIIKLPLPAKVRVPSDFVSHFSCSPSENQPAVNPDGKDAKSIDEDTQCSIVKS